MFNVKLRDLLIYILLPEYEIQAHEPSGGVVTVTKESLQHSRCCYNAVLRKNNKEDSREAESRRTGGKMGISIHGKVEIAGKN